MKELAVRAGTGLTISASPKHRVAILGHELALEASAGVQLVGSAVSIEAKWNQDVQLLPHGGAVTVDSMRLDGSRLSSASPEEDMVIASHNDIVLEPSEGDGTVRIQGGFQVQDPQSSTVIRSATLMLETSTLNADIELQPLGGQTKMGALTLSGSALSTHDSLKPSGLLASANVAVKGQAVRLEGYEVLIATTGEIQLQGNTLALETGFNADVEVRAPGAGLASGSVTIDASTIETADKERPPP